MASLKMALLGALPAVLLLLACSDASFVSATTALETDSPTDSLEHLDAFVEHLLENNDFADEETFAETQSARDLVPFLRSAFSANDSNAIGVHLPEGEVAELLEMLQDIEHLHESEADLGENSASDEDVTQKEVAATKNAKVITRVLTRLASLATVKNMVARKASSLLDLLMSLSERATNSVKIAKRVANMLKELAKLQERLMDLADKFIALLRDAINIITQQWEAGSQRRQKVQVLDFFKFLLKWAGAAKEASLKKWQLVKALYTIKEDTDSKTREEKVATPGRLRMSKASLGAESVDDHTNAVSSLKKVASSYLDTLFAEAEQARRVERDAAQSVWHHAAKCAREGFVSLPFVRVVLGEN